jgi:hypothetical protein
MQIHLRHIEKLKGIGLLLQRLGGAASGPRPTSRDARKKTRADSSSDISAVAARVSLVSPGAGSVQRMTVFWLMAARPHASAQTDRGDHFG